VVPRKQGAELSGRVVASSPHSHSILQHGICNLVRHFATGSCGNSENRAEVKGEDVLGV